MSRAFVKEDDTAAAEVELPAVAPHLISPAGRQALVARRAGLDGQEGMEAAGEKARLDALLAAATVVPPLAAVPDAACFGTVVTIEDEEGEAMAVTLVGEHEADPAAGRVSCLSPLGRALVGAHVGDSVTWRRPAGDRVLDVVALGLPAAP